MSAGMPVLLHAGVPDSGYHWLGQGLVILLIAGVWVLFARVGERLDRRRRAWHAPTTAPRPSRTIASRIVRRWVPRSLRTARTVRTGTPRTPSPDRRAT